MNPQLQSYHDRFAEARDAMRDLAAELAEDIAAKSPATDAWSVVQIIEHMCVVGGLLLPRIDVGIEEAIVRNLRSDGPFKYPPMSRIIIRAVSPLTHEKQSRMRVPRIYRPEERRTLAEASARFIVLQEDFMERCENADGLDIARVALGSPVTPMIRLRLGAWFESLATHQERHFGQIERALAALGVEMAEVS